MSDKKPEDEGVTFDIYHFFSRKDVLAAAVVIVLVLAYLAFRHLAAPSGV